MDGRSREARLMRAVRDELVQHVGGKPSVTQMMQIEQAAQIKFRLCLMDAKIVETGTQSDHDSRQYLAWSNSLSRLLRAIGLKGVAERPPDLAAYLAGHAKAPGNGAGGAVSTPLRTPGPAEPLAVPPTASVKVS